MRAAPPSGQVLAPLFDRLVEWGPEERGEHPSRGLLDEEELRASVRREVAYVLGTRCSLSLREESSLAPAGRSVLDYGMPDVGTLSLESSAGARRLEQLIARAVEAFEPRLELIQVSVQAPTSAQARPVALITARLAHTPPSSTLSFPLWLDRSGRLVEVGDEYPEG